MLVRRNRTAITNDPTHFCCCADGAMIGIAACSSTSEGNFVGRRLATANGARAWSASASGCDLTDSAAMKVYSCMSGRRASTDIRALAEKGLIDDAPHYNRLHGFIECADVTDLLKTLVEESAAPLKAVESQFAVDSTGFATSVYARWCDHKYGREMSEQRWIKCHAMVGVKTNIITSVEVTESTANDSPELPALVATTAKRFDIAELSADKAYVSVPVPARRRLATTVRATSSRAPPRGARSLSSPGRVSSPLPRALQRREHVLVGQAPLRRLRARQAPRGPEERSERWRRRSERPHSEGAGVCAGRASVPADAARGHTAREGAAVRPEVGPPHARRAHRNCQHSLPCREARLRRDRRPFTGGFPPPGTCPHCGHRAAE